MTVRGEFVRALGVGRVEQVEGRAALDLLEEGAAGAAGNLQLGAGLLLVVGGDPLHHRQQIGGDGNSQGLGSLHLLGRQ